VQLNLKFDLYYK